MLFSGCRSGNVADWASAGACASVERDGRGAALPVRRCGRCGRVTALLAQVVQGIARILPAPATRESAHQGLPVGRLPHRREFASPFELSIDWISVSVFWTRPNEKKCECWTVSMDSAPVFSYYHANGSWKFRFIFTLNWTWFEISQQIFQAFKRFFPVGKLSSGVRTRNVVDSIIICDLNSMQPLNAIRTSCRLSFLVWCLAFAVMNCISIHDFE